jgi:hypothetical protein
MRATCGLPHNNKLALKNRGLIDDYFTSIKILALSIYDWCNTEK